MVIGQASGIAAALAADQDLAVQKLNYETLRKRLLAQKQVLELPDPSSLLSTSESIAAQSLPGIILDDTDAQLTGDWSRSTNFKPSIDNGYLFSGERGSRAKGDGKSVATFRFQAPKSGEYRLLMAYSPHQSRAKNVPVTVTSGGGRREFVVDQTQALPKGKHFRGLGHVQLEGGVETVITITNRRTAGFVIVDALQLLPKTP
jgi:hypothetical protein